jgi:hypothetical protein
MIETENNWSERRDQAGLALGVAPADLPLPLTALARVPAHALAARIAPWMMALFRWRDAQP